MTVSAVPVNSPHQLTRRVQMMSSISDKTRRTIIDFFLASGTPWAGRLAESDFLARLYDLTKLPSHDHRISNAAGDINQHRVSFQDWEDDWVFFDNRFNIVRASDEEFLGFLAETVHPVVRPDTESARSLVTSYNSELKRDGWELAEVRQIAGNPVFGAHKIGQRDQVFEEPTGWPKVDRQLQEVRHRLESAVVEEQYQAVGLLCREVLITVAQEVFDPDRHSSDDEEHSSSTDARRMLEAVFELELFGSANKEARAHAKGALRLAVALQHKRTADFRMAAFCAEATSSVVNLLAVLGNRRGRLM